MTHINWLSPQADRVLPRDAELYLHTFRRGLLVLPESERLSITGEIREQLAGQAALGGVALQKLLVALGDPDKLSRRFVLTHELQTGLSRSNPAGLFVAVLASASRSVMALVVGLLAALFYVIGFSAALLALLKPFFPTSVGMWAQPSGLLMGFVDSPPGGPELLGYWLVPLYVCTSVAAIVLATRVLRLTGRRMLKTLLA